MGGKDGFSVNEIFSPLPEGQDAGVVGGMSLLERKKKKRPSSSSLSLIKLSEGRNADDYVFTWACSSSWTVRVAVFHGADQKEEDEQKRRLTCLALHKKKKKKKQTRKRRRQDFCFQPGTQRPRQQSLHQPHTERIVSHDALRYNYFTPHFTMIVRYLLLVGSLVASIHGE